MTNYPKQPKLNPDFMTQAPVNRGKDLPLESMERPYPRWLGSGWPIWLSIALIIAMVVVMGVSTGVEWPL